MNLGIRSKLSLCQFLLLLSHDEFVLLLQKYGMATEHIEFHWDSPLEGLKLAMLGASSSQIGELVHELARTRSSIRSHISPRSRFEERWQDVLICLQLDNYALARDEYGQELDHFEPTQPVIEGAQPVEDDLSKELARSGLSQTNEILQLVANSASAFLRADYNGCLSNARVALETLAKSIAQERLASQSKTGELKKWGEVVSFLKTSGFITDGEEKGLAGVYGFISLGSHSPLGFTESEFARLGRTLALSYAYFLVKRRNAR